MAVLMAGPPLHICKLGRDDPKCKMSTANAQASSLLASKLQDRILLRGSGEGWASPL